MLSANFVNNFTKKHFLQIYFFNYLLLLVFYDNQTFLDGYVAKKSY